MRTTPEENAKLGQIMAQRLNQLKGPTYKTWKRPAWATTWRWRPLPWPMRWIC
ncbi:MAG: hypothetical protein GX487_00275 [Acetomicrobium flavidum]|uniref:hypothetical protein n=1 Tax=Acetomicrobium flavidum TaxID=49896 RepID=UPI0011783C6A|nr:hypothetical protein [Acetomicrobium flavidum]